MKELRLYDKTKPKVKKKKKLEFMQRVVLIALSLPFLWVTFSYILAYLEKPNTLEDLSVCVVSVPIMAIVGYITQNSIRSATFNKFGGVKYDSRPTVFFETNYPVSDSRYEEI